MTQLEEQLYSLIEDWVAALGLDGLDEVAGAIAETNYIFDEIYVEDIDFDKEDDSRYTFKCEISMTGEPRKDDVVFSGDTINVVIEGAVFFDEDEEAWVVDDDYDISAEVQDWGPEADDRQLSLKYARRQPGLKKISITNFKGIGPQVDIELKPVTLLFGPNSAGKSTILHAIHCAYTILVTGNANVENTILGGDIDLGGFLNYVHNRDTTNATEFSFEFVPGKKELFELLEAPFQATGRPSPIPAHRIQNIAVSMRIEWSHMENQPFVTMFSVKINSKDIAEIRVGREGRNAVLRVTSRGLPSYENWGGEVFERALDGPGFVMDYPIDLESHSALPGDKISQLPLLLGFANPVSQIDIDDSILGAGDGSGDGRGDGYGFGDGAGGGRGDGSGYGGGADGGDWYKLGLLLSLARPCLTKALEGFRYVGPIRTAPSRMYTPPKVLDEKRWAKGLGAWDSLCKSEALRKNVSTWLHDTERLGTGYKIDWISTTEIDAALEFQMRQSARNMELDEFFERYMAQAQQKQRLVVLNKENLELSLSDLGEGITQIVPVLAAALSTEMLSPSGEEEKVQHVILEQPELHIHPRMQVVLGDLFLIESQVKHFLIETHSEHIMLRLLRRIRETAERDLPKGAPAATKDNVAVLYVDNPNDGPTQITPLRIDDEGEFVDQWPGGFFDERGEELF